MGDTVICPSPGKNKNEWHEKRCGVLRARTSSVFIKIVEGPATGHEMWRALKQFCAQPVVVPAAGGAAAPKKSVAEQIFGGKESDVDE